MTSLSDKTNNTIYMNVDTSTGHTIDVDRIILTGYSNVTNVAYKNSTQISKCLPELWMVPSRNSNFIGRAELLKQIEHHFSHTHSSIILAACHGLGGIGKTQLALEFVWQHYKIYRGVVWFDAVSQQILQYSYISLGRTLNIIGEEEIDDQELCLRVKGWLENDAPTGWLLVYDNAPRYDLIKELLPVKGGKILVTSRYSAGWSVNIPVNVFTIEESREYVKIALESSLSEGEKNKLGEILGRLPLALAIACAFIKKNHMKISRYFELYAIRKQEFLSKSLLHDQLLMNADGNSKFCSVYVTWDITMDRVSKESQLADNWLNACAYLASNNIPEFLLREFANIPENNPNNPPENFINAIGTLNSYSMITINEQNDMTIHPLVQEAIQLKWKTLEIENSLVKVVYLLEKIASDNRETMEYLEKVQKLLQHLEALLPHIEYFQRNVVRSLLKNEDNTEKNYEENVLLLLAEWYHILGFERKARVFWEREAALEEQKFGPNHPKVAATLINLGIAYNNLGEYNKALEMYERALSINEKHCGPDYPSLAVILTNLRIKYQKSGDYKEALEMYERTLPILERYYGPDHPEVAVILTNLGITYEKLGNYKKSLEIHERAVQINERYYGPNHPSVAVILTNLGNTYNCLGDYKKALDIYERTLPIFERHYGPDHPEVAVILTNFGSAYGKSGNFKKALDIYKRALLIKEKHCDPDHPSVIITLTNLGSTYNYLGDNEKAVKIYERAMPILERHYGPDHQSVAVILTNLGIAYQKLGDYKKALDIYERTLPIFERHYGPDHPEVAVILTNLGGAYCKSGNFKKALDMYKRALLIKEKHYGPEHQSVVAALINLGIAYQKLGDCKKSLEIHERALQINERYYGPDHPEVAVVLVNLGNSYSYFGDYNKAFEIFERALLISVKHLGHDHPNTISISELLVEVRSSNKTCCTMF